MKARYVVTTKRGAQYYGVWEEDLDHENLQDLRNEGLDLPNLENFILVLAQEDTPGATHLRQEISLSIECIESINLQIEDYVENEEEKEWTDEWTDEEEE